MTLRLAVGLLLGVVACTANPSIDGSAVPTVGSPTTPASCADLCARLRKICGYAPLECTTADGGGYCAEQFDTSHRVCVGQAASCKDALACANDDADGASDAGADSGAGDATGNDAAADAATDAKGQ